MEPQLAVSFAPDRDGRTYLARQRATHPFHLCRPLYRPGDPKGLSTLYIQGCAGGVFEGDRLATTVRVERGAAAHLTTAAATIVHRMPGGGRAEVDVRLEICTGALLEYFPDPLILFPGSRLASRLEIVLEPGARAIAIDSVLTHQLPDDLSPFDWLDSRLHLRSGERLLARERAFMRGRHFAQRRIGITGSRRCLGTVLVLGASEGALGTVRDACADHSEVSAGVSELPDGAGLIARVLAHDPAALRACLHRLFFAARHALDLVPGTARPK